MCWNLRSQARAAFPEHGLRVLSAPSADHQPLRGAVLTCRLSLGVTQTPSCSPAAAPAVGRPWRKPGDTVRVRGPISREHPSEARPSFLSGDPEERGDWEGRDRGGQLGEWTVQLLNLQLLNPRFQTSLNASRCSLALFSSSPRNTERPAATEQHRPRRVGQPLAGLCWCHVLLKGRPGWG